MFILTSYTSNIAQKLRFARPIDFLVLIVYPNQRIGYSSLELIKRQNPQGLPHCCFIFDPRGESSSAYFRVYYDDDRANFVDYHIDSHITPFVYFKNSDDVELKEYRRPDGNIYRMMSFPENALSAGEVPLLKPGEIWEAKSKISSLLVLIGPMIRSELGTLSDELSALVEILKTNRADMTIEYLDFDTTRHPTNKFIAPLPIAHYYSDAEYGRKNPTETTYSEFGKKAVERLLKNLANGLK